jgi:hypothetical protein
MKNIILITASAILIVVGYSCKIATKTKAQNNAPFNYDYLYNKIWVVDTIIVLGANAVNMETDKNEYQFTKKEGTRGNEGTRTTISSLASINLSYIIKDGALHFDPAAMFPITKFDENGNIISYRDVSLPPYKIMELSSNRLTLENNDILMKLKAK